MTTTQLRMTFEETPPGKTYSAPSVPTASEQLLAPAVAVVTGPAIARTKKGRAKSPVTSPDANGDAAVPAAAPEPALELGTFPAICAFFCHV